MTPTADPFDTASLRAAVLDAWRSSPTRYREDANVEEDYALGAYRDRLVVELAQNAADAARAAGVPGRLRIVIGDDGLAFANAGAPLDLAGVHSLSAMRASAKSGDGVGRFGVGFAAVLSVTDAPAVASRNGGVRFSRTDSAELLLKDPELARLVKTRRPPALRLPFAYRSDLPPEYDTIVVLPWLDADARDRGLDAVAAIDDALFVALPDLHDLVVERLPGGPARRWHAERQQDLLTLHVDGATRRWLLRTVEGEWTENALTGAPTESRAEDSWRLTWALPVTDAGAPQPWPIDERGGAPLRVVHAPTPTDEPLALAALLVADLPVDASRRRLAVGPMTNVILDAAVEAYADLVVAIAEQRGAEAVALVPEPDFLGSVDDRMRTGIRERLGCVGWLPRGRDGSAAAPSELVGVEPANPELVAVVAPYVSDLLAADWTPHVPVLRALGLTVRAWSEVWDVLATAGLSGDDWHRVYDAAASLDAQSLEGIPVLLAGGRVVRGARGVVFAEGDPEALAMLGVDCVDPSATHPLLLRLGAQRFDVRNVLDRSFVAHVAEAVATDEIEARAMVEAAARLLTQGDVQAGQLPWLGSVLVPVAAGGWAPASSVVLPGSRLDTLADPDAPRLASGTDVTSGWTALGVLADLVPVSVTELPLEPDVWESQAPDGGAWCLDVADRVGAEEPADLLAVETVVVRGLELVATSHEALALISAPAIRSAIMSEAVVLTGDGRRVSVPSPSAWWLGEAPLLDGRCPVEVRLAGDDRLAPFFPEVPLTPDTDRGLLAALGAHTTLEGWLAVPGGVDELLAALADPTVEISPEMLVQVGAALAEVDDLPDPPHRVRAVVGGTTAVVDAAEAVVAIAPHHALVLRTPHLPGPERLADVLDLAASDDAACGASGVAGSGARSPVPALPTSGDWPTEYREHDTLTVASEEVDWWVTDDGEVHAATVDGLARGLAWAGGCWNRRFELASLLELTADDRADRVERYFD